MGAAKLPDVASLAWGLSSFSTPERIRSAATQALGEARKASKHKLPVGSSQLRETVAYSFFGLTNRQVSVEHIVVVTAGNMQSVKVILNTMLDPGDEFIVTDPGLVSQENQDMDCRGKELMQRAKVSDKRGSDFAPLGEGQVRMKFCVSGGKIDKGFEPIARHFAT